MNLGCVITRKAAQGYYTSLEQKKKEQKRKEWVKRWKTFSNCPESCFKSCSFSSFSTLSLNNHMVPDLRVLKNVRKHPFLAGRHFVKPLWLLIWLSSLSGRGSLAVRNSVVKDIIMNPLLSPDKSSIMDCNPLLLGSIWPCHLRPISNPVDFLVCVAVQLWPVNGFSTHIPHVQNEGRLSSSMTTWWRFFFPLNTKTQLYVSASGFWTRGLYWL